MSDADAGVESAEEAEGGEDFWIRIDGGAQDGGGEDVEGERGVASPVAEEASRDPPERSAEQDAGADEGQAQEQQDMGELVAQFPGGGGCVAGLEDFVFGLAEVSAARS